jgi:hypothetical protein
LSSNISRLRTLLTSAEPDAVTIDGVGDGYRLSTDATRVDWHRFRCLVERARAADDDLKKIDLFDRALALWRGPALLTIAPTTFAAGSPVGSRRPGWWPWRSGSRPGCGSATIGS